jgi:hypothetical protein
MKGVAYLSKTKSVANKSQTKKISVKELTCVMCGKTKKVSEFYQSFNPIHQTGKLPYCKACLKTMCLDSNGNIDITKVKEMLKLIDRPFIYDLFKSSMEDKMDTVGAYIKNLALNNKRDGWKDSIFEPQLDNNSLNYSNYNLQNNKADNFIPTDETYEKWGFGYSNEEYYYFEKKWNKLIDNYGEKTSFHVEGLITYIRFRVKEELATAQGNVKDAKDWAALAKDAATAAKINVSQLSKSDLSGGVDLLPQLFEAVESEVGVIPILPKLKEQPIDDADLIIWCIINYNRRLDDKPRIQYKDIWNFYDEMLNEYFHNQGYSDEQINIEKKKRNSIFRDLSKVYIEPIYEEGE